VTHISYRPTVIGCEILLWSLQNIATFSAFILICCLAKGRPLVSFVSQNPQLFVSRPSEVHTYIPDTSYHTDTIAPGHAYKDIPLMTKELLIGLPHISSGRTSQPLSVLYIEVYSSCSTSNIHGIMTSDIIPQQTVSLSSTTHF